MSNSKQKQSVDDLMELKCDWTYKSFCNLQESPIYVVYYFVNIYKCINI